MTKARLGLPPNDTLREIKDHAAGRTGHFSGFAESESVKHRHRLKGGNNGTLPGTSAGAIVLT